MKKTCALGIVFYFLIVGVVCATPPEEIQISYDEGVQGLSIQIKHITLKTHKHFIHKIIIFLNGEEVKDFYRTFQVSPEWLTLQVPIVLEPEDEIRVEAKCNKGGSLSKTFEMNLEK